MVSLAFSMSLASFGATRSTPLLPGCRGWHFRRCPGGPGPALWTWRRPSPGRLVACPYGAYRRFVSPGQQYAGEALQRPSLLTRGVVHDGRLNLDTMTLVLSVGDDVIDLAKLSFASPQQVFHLDHLN